MEDILLNLFSMLASSIRLATPLIFAAMGGMAIPVAIYSAINFGQISAAGWGIPMSSDMAFALGVLAIAGRWLPKQIPKKGRPSSNSSLKTSTWASLA